MRAFERPDTVILTGTQLYDNYIRPHEAPEGTTPAEAAGITVEGQNKVVNLNSERLKESKLEGTIDAYYLLQKLWCKSQ